MKSLQFIEVDVPHVRQSLFSQSQASIAVPDWSQAWATNSTFTGITDSNFPSGKGGRLEKTGVGAQRHAWTWDVITSAADVSIYTYQKGNGSLAQLGSLARVSGTPTLENAYYFAAQLNASTMTIGQFSGGVFTTLDTEVFTANVGEYYWQRFDCITSTTGVLLRGKIWQGSIEDEPEDWMIEFDDTTPLASGLVGMFINQPSNTIDLGYFSVAVIGEEDTFRFALPTDYLPRDLDCIPSIGSINFTPAVMSLGKDLGQRATLTITLKDHRHILGDEDFNTGTFWGKWRARYGQKLRGRSVRWINGLLGQQFESMPTRHFFIDSTDGPTPDGVYTIVAKDLLKFADDDRALAPALSNGSLAGSITNSDVSATLSPSGIGNLEYPASGHICLGGKEVVEFTRTNDTLSITRAQFNTTAIAHDAGERAQLVLYYDGDDVADIINDLLVNYANIDSSYIPLSEWQAETAANLGSVIYARVITEPTAVNKLISELIEQAGLCLWWNDSAQIIRLQVLKEIATDAATFDEEVILDKSLKVKEQPDKRISQIWTYYGQRNPTDRGDDEDNYRAALATVDLERETEYGSPLIRTIKGQWVATENAASRLNQLQISRFRDPPRRFNFDLFPGAAINVGSGYRLRWHQNQNVLGEIVEEGAPIQITRLAVEAGVIHIEAEEMLASGVIVLTNVVILTTTGSVLNWTVPDDWNDANNTIECIGGGGGGGGSSENAGSGGGGGAYSAITNLTLPITSPPTEIQYRIGSGGAGAVSDGSSSGSAGSDTWFNGANFAAASVGARAGTGGAGNAGTPGTGGQASSGIGDVTFSGGNGGRGFDGGTYAGAGGGGGAGGPNGDGANGGGQPGDEDNGAGGGSANGGSDGTILGVGGNNRFGTGGGPINTDGIDGAGGGGGFGSGSSAQPGGDGGVGEQLWTQTIAPIFSAGPGGGGGGGGGVDNGTPGKGGAGGLYGGGGGGAGGKEDSGSNNTTGTGAQGVIIITWTP